MTTTVDRPPVSAPPTVPASADTTITYKMITTDGTADTVTWNLFDRDSIVAAEALFTRKVHGGKYLAYSVTPAGPTVIRSFDPMGDVVLSPQLVGG